LQCARALITSTYTHTGTTHTVHITPLTLRSRVSIDGFLAIGSSGGYQGVGRGEGNYVCMHACTHMHTPLSRSPRALAASVAAVTVTHHQCETRAHTSNARYESLRAHMHTHLCHCRCLRARLCAIVRSCRVGKKLLRVVDDAWRECVCVCMCTHYNNVAS
jgi:hypothetical protein